MDLESFESTGSGEIRSKISSPDRRLGTAIRFEGP